MPISADLGHLSFDPALADKIMKKRNAEIARRAKLQDLKFFKFGVKHDSLNEQVLEKRGTAELEAAEGAYYAQSALLQDQILETVETMKAEAVRNRHKEVIAYSLQNLAKEQRREYHLSNPNVLKNTDPMEECFGPQERGNPKDVKKAAQKLQAQWLLEQMQEKKERQQAEKDLDTYYDQRMTVAAQVATLVEETALQEDKADKCAEAAENLRLAELHRARRLAEKQKDATLKDRHLGTIKGDAGLAEAVDWKVGATGKLLKAEYKRLSVDEEADVYNTNARIVLEKRLAKATEKMDERREANLAATCAVVLGAVEDRVSSQARDRAIKMKEENFRLAAQQREARLQEKAAYKAFDY